MRRIAVALVVLCLATLNGCKGCGDLIFDLLNNHYSDGNTQIERRLNYEEQKRKWEDYERQKEAEANPGQGL
jgi:hypothetical protein